MKAPTVSVALCTYNSARFLPAQLESLRAQTHPPDEVVISDDASSDATAAVAAEFRERSGLRVNFILGKSRVGFGQNFARAIAACESDYIFLCDHDDEWLPTKIERQLRALAEDPGAVLAVSDATLVDAELKPLGTTTWRTIGFSEAERAEIARGENYPLLLRKYVASGHTMAFPARLREILLPVPEGWAHDAWIPLVLGAIGRLIVIPAELVRYRQHTGQAVGLRASQRTLRLRDRWRSFRAWSPRKNQRIAQETRTLLERLRKFAAIYPVSSENFQMLEYKIAHFSRRGALPGSFIGRSIPIARELLRGRYHAFENGFASAAKDLFASGDSDL